MVRAARMRVLVLVAVCLAVVGVNVALAAPLEGPAAAQRVLELTNVERRNAGLGTLVLSPQLNDAAQGYAQVLAGGDCFAHTCGPVPDFGVRFRDAGYTGWSSIAENIAAGYATPDDVVAGWMASPGHRQNILTPGFTEMGVGVVSGSGKFGTYWAEAFGARAVAAAPAEVQQDEAPAPADDADGSAG
jgi:uncharacterized protein YkwD